MIPMVRELVPYEHIKEGGTKVLRQIFHDDQIGGYEIP